MTRSKLLGMLAVLLVAMSFGQTAHAALNAVGPINPNNGFPLWNQDGNALALELCIPDAAELAAGTCLLLPADIPDPASPIVFPSNFPEEAFWWAADASIDLPGGGKALLVLALEAAFLNGGPVAGDQISFGRVRLRIDVPADGTYTVTYPFGVHTETVTAGTRAINTTIDIGIGAPGDFTGALLSKIGPFLRPSATPGGPPLPFADLFPESGRLYVANPDVPTAVTGGTVSNIFRIEGPDIGGLGVNSIETDQFTLMGRLFSGILPVPLTVDRSTYNRSVTNQGKVAVFATSAPTATLTVAGGPNLPGGPIPMVGDGAGKFFAHIDLQPDATTLPPFVTVTANNPGNSETVLGSSLVDAVTITKAEHINGTLTIQAYSSDELVSPTLTAVGLGDLVSGSFSVNTLLPPPFVTVDSSAGGSDSQIISLPISISPVAGNDDAITNMNTQVVIEVLTNDTDPDGSLNPASVAVGRTPINGIATANGDGTVSYTPTLDFVGKDSFTYTVKDSFSVESNVATVVVTVNPPVPPIAGDDAAATASVPVNIPVLGNDSPAGTLVPTSVVLKRNALNGISVASPLGDGTVDYTPTAGFVGKDSFTYSVKDNLGIESNVATVVVTVTPVPNNAPVAVNDSATTGLNVPVVIDVLANDNDGDTGTPVNLDPRSVALASTPAHGSVLINPATGAVTYVPGANYVGGDSFNYTVRDTLGALSGEATVTITVTGSPTAINVTRAQYTAASRQWVIEGTTSAPRTSLVIHAGPNLTGPVVGADVAGIGGKWKFSQRNSPIAPDATNTISIRAADGSVLLSVSVTVK